MMVDLYANGNDPDSKTMAVLKPNGYKVEVAGSQKNQVYHASHEMVVFNNKAPEIKIVGTLTDIVKGKLVTSLEAKHLKVTQNFLECKMDTPVKVVEGRGFFSASVKPRTDGRSFGVTITYDHEGYLQTVEKLKVDAFVKNNVVNLELQTVQIKDRALGGQYRF